MKTKYPRDHCAHVCEFYIIKLEQAEKQNPDIKIDDNVDVWLNYCKACFYMDMSKLGRQR